MFILLKRVPIYLKEMLINNSDEYYRPVPQSFKLGAINNNRYLEVSSYSPEWLKLCKINGTNRNMIQVDSNRVLINFYNFVTNAAIGLTKIDLAWWVVYSSAVPGSFPALHQHL
jgi:hypothetical protein